MKRYRIKPGDIVHLDRFDPNDTALAPGSKEATAGEMAKIEKKLRDLQELLFAEQKHRVLIVLQGMDSSGKDGTVRHVMTGFNPAGVFISSFKQPTEQELAHDYLWRVHARTPGNGEIAVFNRSHYEDVLVVRIHNLVPRDVWMRRYDQINDFERMLSENETLILKFFLHISRDEQRVRLQARLDDPTKRWKFQHGDVEERKRWHDYRMAYEDLLTKTSTEWAPWWVIPANAKWYRNFLVGTIIAEALEKLDMRYPEPDLSKEVVE